ncbi:MAG TPA: hypothetical protein VMT52_11225 [Planctomycetota bacterium]|nr:hypothetical protein [Planctomycetota bacterium]
MESETLSIVAKVLNTLIALIVLPIGLAYRRRPGVHIPIMLSAFAVDVVNVILVEVVARMHSSGAGAVEQGVRAFTGGEASFIQQFHIAVSVLCILGYVVAVVTGLKLHRRGILRRTHRANAAVFLLTRLLSYVTSFWM